MKKLLHFVWMGKKASNKRLEVITTWLNTNKNFIAYFWIDNAELSDDYKKAINEIGGVGFFEKMVKIKNIEGDLFNEIKNQEKQGVFPKNTYEKAQGVFKYETFKLNPNYAAASDLLRYFILWLYGGGYIDMDNFSSSIPLQNVIKKHDKNTIYLATNSQGEREGESNKPITSNPLNVASDPIYVPQSQHPDILKTIRILLDHYGNEFENHDKKICKYRQMFGAYSTDDNNVSGNEYNNNDDTSSFRSRRAEEVYTCDPLNSKNFLYSAFLLQKIYQCGPGAFHEAFDNKNKKKSNKWIFNGLNRCVDSNRNQKFRITNAYPIYFFNVKGPTDSSSGFPDLSNRTEKELPVIVKSGNEVKIYWINEKQEKCYTSLDPNKFSALPWLENVFILYKSDKIPREIYSEIAAKLNNPLAKQAASSWWAYGDVQKFNNFADAFERAKYTLEFEFKNMGMLKIDNIIDLLRKSLNDEDEFKKNRETYIEKILNVVANLVTEAMENNLLPKNLVVHLTFAYPESILFCEKKKLLEYTGLFPIYNDKEKNNISDVSLRLVLMNTLNTLYQYLQEDVIYYPGFIPPFNIHEKIACMQHSFTFIRLALKHLEQNSFFDCCGYHVQQKIEKNNMSCNYFDNSLQEVIIDARAKIVLKYIYALVNVLQICTTFIDCQEYRDKFYAEQRAKAVVEALKISRKLQNICRALLQRFCGNKDVYLMNISKKAECPNFSERSSSEFPLLVKHDQTIYFYASFKDKLLGHDVSHNEDLTHFQFPCSDGVSEVKIKIQNATLATCFTIVTFLSQKIENGSKCDKYISLLSEMQKKFRKIDVVLHELSDDCIDGFLHEHPDLQGNISEILDVVKALKTCLPQRCNRLKCIKKINNYLHDILMKKEKFDFYTFIYSLLSYSYLNKYDVAQVNLVCNLNLMDKIKNELEKNEEHGVRLFANFIDILTEKNRDYLLFVTLYENKNKLFYVQSLQNKEEQEALCNIVKLEEIIAQQIKPFILKAVFDCDNSQDKKKFSNLIKLLTSLPLIEENMAKKTQQKNVVSPSYWLSFLFGNINSMTNNVLSKLSCEQQKTIIKVLKDANEENVAQNIEDLLLKKFPPSEATFSTSASIFITKNTEKTEDTPKPTQSPSQLFPQPFSQQLSIFMQNPLDLKNPNPQPNF